MTALVVYTVNGRHNLINQHPRMTLLRAKNINMREEMRQADVAYMNLNVPGFIPTPAVLRPDGIIRRIEMAVETPALASDLARSIADVIRLAGLNPNNRHQLSLIGPAGVRRYDLGPPSMSALHLAPWRNLVQERGDFMVVVMIPVENEDGEALSRAIHIQTPKGEAIVEIPCIEFGAAYEFALAKARVTSLTGEFANLPCFYGRRNKDIKAADPEQMRAIRDLDFVAAGCSLVTEKKLTMMPEGSTVH